VLHALIVKIHESRLDVTLHNSLAEAEKAAAKRVLRLMGESSALDLGEDMFLMSEANERDDHSEVVRLFERQQRRQVVFIQPVAAPKPSETLPANTTSACWGSLLAAGSVACSWIPSLFR
jgi:hypothetical protein